MHGRHLTLSDREVLAQRHARGEHPAYLAQELGCHVRTVYRELERNTTNGQYYPARAQVLADQRRRVSKQPWKLEDPSLGQYVQEKLTRYWSPEQISGRLEIDFPDRPAMRISPQALYEWIARQKAAGGSWHAYLRQSHRKRRKRYGSRENRGRIVDRVGIEQRPPEVQAKSRLGDWESDTIAGSSSPACLASHVERVSRYTVLAKLPDAKAASLNAGTVRAFARHGNLPRHTTTADNGKEFAAHAAMSHKLGWSVYFANPYRAWERGLNENTNGLVRQFFPKGLDLACVSSQDVRRAEELLNHRPRKSLNYRTPTEVMSQSP
jgi:IS30 family transposase